MELFSKALTVIRFLNPFFVNGFESEGKLRCQENLDLPLQSKELNLALGIALKLGEHFFVFLQERNENIGLCRDLIENPTDRGTENRFASAYCRYLNRNNEAKMTVEVLIEEYEPVIAKVVFDENSRRLETMQEFRYLAFARGAEKMAAFPNLWITPNGGKEGDFLSFAIYPRGLSQIVTTEFREKSPLGVRVTCEPATVVPINGSMKIRVVPGVLDPYNLVAQAVQEHINPPRGKWGDRDFKKSLAVAIETQSEGTCLVQETELVRADTEEQFEEIRICSWMLFEIQNDIRLEFV